MPLYENMIRPLLFKAGPETAHETGLALLRFGFGLKPIRALFARAPVFDGIEPVRRFGLEFPNPLGMAAGFDKNGVAALQIAALGFGFVEIGTVTYEPQPGNEKPRLFRLPEDAALINRLGFNNDGAVKVSSRLARRRPQCVVGVNIGRNKDVPNDRAVENYLKCFELSREVADYIAVNVSSPNTPGLRDLQAAEALEVLLCELQKANGKGALTRPLLVKIAPDLEKGDIERIVDIAMRNSIAGIIATNTSVRRQGLKTSAAELERIGSGGLSGKPIASMSNKVIEQVYRASGGALPIIGVGGIFTAEDAFQKIASGASLLQAYTGFVYKGPGFARDINLGLAQLMEERGFKALDEVVGSNLSRVRQQQV